MRSVVVAGGGITGWAAAAALKRRLPMLEVTVLPIAPPADALADRFPATLPSILAFHGDLGLSEADAIVRTRAGFRLGSRFVGWGEGLPDYVHSYGTHGPAIEGTAFHQHWLRARDAAPFDRHAPAAMLGREGRFVPAGEAPIDGYEYGLVLDLPAQTAMLRAFALHLGVREAAGAFRTLTLEDSGFARAIDTNAGPLAADLFVDATGPAAQLRSAMGGARDDWRRWLSCDRFVIAAEAAAAPPGSLDTVEAQPTGWRFRIEGLNETTTGACWSSAHDAREGIAFEAGSFAEPWLRNVVAIGDAATVVEPLEWTNLHLALSGIDRLVTMMPGRDCAPVEIAEFNRQAAAEAVRVRDFLMLHYVTARRPEPFWREMAAAELPDTLAHTLTQFAERGRLPFYEEETFARDSWLAVLFGQGVRPRRLDPLVEAIDPAPIAAGMARHRDAIAAAAARAPTHAAFLQALHRQALR
ncbi:tryptophan halogenase [Sphingomonas spermidinifaciens]|uniref:Tryptophan halogenase n=1 Tax=Sphingomonas spermidinifaciens TaxID=1141889 RepID=A0A2A4B512_9SPHN|nr:tryptophan 7-halogenase [Sphingomonas spermidinifaciens]PCD02869.1 tryptophan halogenase [Sphingomonas spermidinifaciens]